MMLEKADDYIINKVQVLYDYVWDAYGVTRGSIFVSIKFLLALLIVTHTDTYIGYRVIWCGIFIISAFKTYTKIHVPQKNGEYKKINNKALELRARKGQKAKLYVLIPVFASFILYNLSQQNYIYALMLLIAIVGMYTQTILVKDREPKDVSFSFNGA